MSELPRSNDHISDGNGMSPNEDQPTSTPSWVKLSVIIAIVFVILVVIIMFVDSGNHGPGRHGFGAGQIG